MGAASLRRRSFQIEEALLTSPFLFRVRREGRQEALLAESHVLTEHVLDQVADLMHDHQPVLADLAARIEPHSTDLIEAWTSAYRKAAVSQPQVPDSAVRDNQEKAVRLLLGW